VFFDDTFDEYKFEYTSIHPATDAQDFTFQATRNASDFNVPIQSAAWRTLHDDAGTTTGAAYDGGGDQVPSDAAYQAISDEVGNGALESVSGELLFAIGRMNMLLAIA
jgi:expansin (peptidoglycan-binding protein)